MICNYTVSDEESNFQHVRIREIPPCAVHADFGGGAAIEVVPGEPEPLMHAAVRAGCKLTDAQIVQCLNMKDIPLPATGTAKGGKLKKRDKAEALVRGLFPSDSDAEIMRMVDRMCGITAAPISQAECPEEVVQTVCSMDPENADCFSKVLKMGLHMLETKRQRETRAAAKHDAEAARKTKASTDLAGLGASSSSLSLPASSSTAELPVDPPPADAAAEGIVALEGTAGSWHNYTPEVFKALIPGKHKLPYVYLRPKPGMLVVVYQSGLDMLPHTISGFLGAPEAAALLGVRSPSAHPLTLGALRCSQEPLVY